MGERLGPRAATIAPAPWPVPSVPPDDIRESVAAIEAASSGEDASRANWPDAAAESSFLALARERGEPAVATTAKEAIAEETDAKALPPLNDLVQRIPADVREVLEDLFRVKYTTVRRVPRKALKP